MLYACDGPWWQLYNGVPGFIGLKVTPDPVAARRFGLKRVWLDPAAHSSVVLDCPGWLGQGGNSGFQALNLAIQFGAKRIVLIGYDMTDEVGVHHFGKHPPELQNPSGSALRAWRDTLDSVAPSIADAGVEVINASPVSALRAFPRMSLRDALQRV